MTLSTPASGHAPALSAVSRRSLLRASPALLAPSLLAGPALASGDTPILRLFREWDAAEAAANNSDWPLGDDDLDSGVDGISTLEERIEAEPVTCLADLAAKIIVSTCWGDFPVSKSFTAECEALLAGDAA